MMALGTMSRDGSVGEGARDGARSKTPPTTPSKAAAKGKLLGVKVLMLDDSLTLFQVQAKASGKMLFEQVCKQLNLLETDYFGLEYTDNRGSTYWLDRDKPMNQQVGMPGGVDPVLRFMVKFYMPDPSQLEEEYTRYLFSLQIKRDLASGQLQCNENTAALMASYIVQAECGDFVVEDYPDHTYLSTFKFVPGQDAELERRICDNHKKHTGQSPAEADLNLLETARRCELYGTKMHPAKDHEGVPLNLAVAHLGVLVFQNCTKINTFSWAKIRKLSFKRKKFLIKLHPEGYGYYKDIVEFYFEERNQCKNFWKKCVEHHGFFRCTDTPNTVSREKPRIISRGSSFRYSGRTQKQMQEHVRENFVKRQSFQRHVRSLHGSTGNVGSSMSAQPLLPTDSDLANGNGSLSSGAGNNNNREVGSGGQPMAWKRQSSTTRPTSPTTNTGSDVDGSSMIFSGMSSNATTSQSTPLHQAAVPASPFRMMREDSVDGTLSPVSMHAGHGMDTLDNDTTGRRKRHPTDKAYFIAKEILMTERTYKKDLEVINLWFRDEVSKEDSMPEETLTLLFSHIDPLYELHATFLKDIEQRMATWEGRGNAHLQGDYRKIGDVILKNLNQNTMEHYGRYIDTHGVVLDKLEQTIHKSSKFEQVYRDFEMQKVCYLPLTTLLLKPLHRVLHYQLLLERLLSHYGPGHHDYTDTNMALSKVRTIIKKLSTKLKESENLVKLMELQRDLVGYDNLVQSGREFVREGCLQKLSRKGYQQRMFFLFSDMLLYANRTTSPGLQFRLHGQLAVPDLQVVDSEPRMGADFCFNIYDGKRALMVAAANHSEKVQWMEDIAETVQYARERGLDSSPTANKYLSLKSMSGSEDGLDRSEMADPKAAEARPSGQRSNSSVHVCWHRATSVAIIDHQRALENQLSGYLLRKFKNSNGWQKLWVVFTNFCLYFYKTFQDDFPLASLPLLGYSVNTPSPADEITKDYVFKLQFKNHVYFFRAESQFTFDRWMEVLSSATQAPGGLDDQQLPLNGDV